MLWIFGLKRVDQVFACGDERGVQLCRKAKLGFCINFSAFMLKHKQGRCLFLHARLGGNRRFNFDLLF